MKIFCFIILSISLISCDSNNKTSHQLEQKTDFSNQILKSEIQNILDSSRLNGSVLIYDADSDIFYSNNFDWANRGFLPASIFKIPNSIIALETGLVSDDTTLFKWDGKERRLKIWEQDLTFREAFHYSCVPCYQDIARNIGSYTMNIYLQKFNYGTMMVDSNSIDNFWLEGESHISQFQQIDFLKRFYNSQIPISKRTELIMKKLMVIEENSNFILSGKTGWSIRNGNNNSWFVGYIKTQNKVYYFATNISPNQQFNMDLFPKIRNEITLKSFYQLGLIM